jgi:RimJ/RimL family protein N-acetyltransferase
VGDVELVTERLILRSWRDDDLDAFAAMNADPRVAEFFPKTDTRAESQETLLRVRAHFATHGFGLWAVEIPGKVSCIGLVGLAVPSYETPFTPCVEVAWRLRFEHWGRGYATEAARAAIAFGFSRLELNEIVAFTTVENGRSRRVMEKLGMRYDPAGDFLHPRVPDGHPLKPHVLYRLSAPQVRPAPIRLSPR